MTIHGVAPTAVASTTGVMGMPVTYSTMQAPEPHLHPQVQQQPLATVDVVGMSAVVVWCAATPRLRRLLWTHYP